jgi:sulfhydrogenase subunit beta (sulfur reductase)
VKYAMIEKRDLNKWLQHLQKKARLYAPKKKENCFIFRPVKDIKEISLKYLPTILPPKKYYYPQKEKLLKFQIRPFKTAKAIKEFQDYILFAVHTCDIAGIQCMDVVFREGPEDPNYLNRKEKMTIIGIECLEYCDKYANCASMGNHLPRGGYDLMMVDLGEKFILHINSEKGERLIRGLNYIKEADYLDMSALERIREAKKKVFKEEFHAPLAKVSEAFDKNFYSPVWKDLGERCLACGNCTTVCPTCYCFDTADEMDLSLNQGLRFRIWDSCQMEDFAKVATGEDFRQGRESRQRHRYYRKFKYPMDKFNRYFCTGCGRCTRSCMAGINLVETVNSLLVQRGEER